MNVTVTEAMDYIDRYDINGISLTGVGRNAAIAILEKRADWTDAHRYMLKRLQDGVNPLPFRLRKLVVRTRLGDALELARDVCRSLIRNQKARARRKAAKARKAAAMAATAAA